MALIGAAFAPSCFRGMGLLAKKLVEVDHGDFESCRNNAPELSYLAEAWIMQLTTQANPRI
jgi:hypothetical protein